MDLRNKRVLITGASRGIGESLAHAFAGAGATVALVARTQDALETLAAELKGSAHPADRADASQLATLVQRVEDEAGPVDVLVNNAGGRANHRSATVIQSCQKFLTSPRR